MTFFDQMHSSWQEKLRQEWQQPYMKKLIAFWTAEVACGKEMYPPAQLVFKAFRQPFDHVRVVIVGQDPYSNPGQADGLAFSVPMGVKIPPSLKNIFKEMADDTNSLAPRHGCLDGLAKQGVLLLNATLTVRKNQPLSHYGKGWEAWTDSVVRILSDKKSPVVFLMWGRAAQAKKEHILKDRGHLILTAAHPSPLSAYAGFFGCRHFSKTNAFLAQNGQMPIRWLDV